jgi:hypothetical protein
MSPKSSLIATARADQFIYLRSLTTGKEIIRLISDTQVRLLALSIDGRLLAAGDLAS